MKTGGFISVFFCLLLLCGCQGNRDHLKSDAYWDAQSCTYYLPAAGVMYSVPDTARVIIAAPEQLPDNILMCVVDTVNYDCVSMVRLDKATEGSISYGYAASEINRIVRQENGVRYKITDRTIKRCEFNGSRAWDYSVNLSIAKDGDTISVMYSGCIFDAGHNPYAFVVTRNMEQNDSAQSNHYIHNLKPIHK